ncbi:MAG: type I glyceraldehyde-3-phosphate dehydrogenase [Coriobacteriia bacterium]|nr:type I glyceraldehyde-3-phosphate dehydrogenase [Coriobacteriia bacterium]
MAIRIGLNGFGRIGRMATRFMLEDPDIELVAVNDFGKIDTVAHLLKYDSVHGQFGKNYKIDGLDLIVDGKRIKGLSDRNPQNLPWGELGVDIVLESTGRFTNRDDAAKHIEAGAKYVVISAPGKGDIDGTFVMGVNHKDFDKDAHHIVSNASCTTNCLSPMIKVLLENFGLEKGFMTTVHAYTNDQKILDLPHKDLRRARAAAMNMIPTTTGAAKTVGVVIPEVKGKLDGMAIRVPTPCGSLTDLTAILEKPASKDEINAAFKAAAEGELKGILEYCEDPVVSIDIVDNPHSCVFDSLLTMVEGDKSTFVKLQGWYDNEYAYAKRYVEFAKYIGQQL